MSERDPGFPADGSAVPSDGLSVRVATAPFHLSQEPVTPEGAGETPAAGAAPAPAFEHLGELPATYGSQSLYLVAYDPRQLFAYWDIDWAKARGKAFALHVVREDGTVEARFELAQAETSRYLPVEQGNARYSLELASRGRDGQWSALATSGPVLMPPEGIAPEGEPTFATLPFHLSFQRLVELLKRAARPRENLTDALGRLQQEGPEAASSLLGALGDLGEDQLRTLEFLAREGFGPLEAGPALGLTDETISSGLTSPGLSSESLSSAAWGSEVRLAAAAAGAEALTSGAFGSQGRWLGGSEQLSSRARLAGPLLSARGMGSESLSSGDVARRAFSAAGALGSEAVSSARGGGGASEAYAAAAARGSEILGRAQRPGASGVSSEAWRRAGAAEAGGSSEGLPSAAFVRAVSTNLEVMGALFSAVDSRLSGEKGGSSSSPSSRGRW